MSPQTVKQYIHLLKAHANKLKAFYGIPNALSCRACGYSCHFVTSSLRHDTLVAERLFIVDNVYANKYILTYNRRYKHTLRYNMWCVVAGLIC